MKKLFRSRGGGPIRVIVDLAIAVGKAIKDRIAGVPEKRFEDLFPNGSRTARAMREEAELNRIRDAAGRTMVDEAPSFGPRREDLP